MKYIKPQLEKIELEIGAKTTFDKVLAIGEEGGELNVGTPVLAGATVEAEVVEQFRAPKVWAFKMKRRKGDRRKVGHRQSLTVATVKAIA